MGKITIKCSCGGKLRYELRDDGGCNDPECCGGNEVYGIKITCKKCKTELDVDA